MPQFTELIRGIAGLEPGTLGLLLRIPQPRRGSPTSTDSCTEKESPSHILDKRGL